MQLRIIQADVTVTTHQTSLGLDKRPILSVHFIVKTTGITEIMAISISPPQWSGSGPAVDALSPLCKEKSNEETAMICINVSITLCINYKVMLLLLWLMVIIQWYNSTIHCEMVTVL